MIKSFQDKDTEALFNGKGVGKFSGFRAQAEKRLVILDSATSIKDLSGLPSNRLEALKGNRKGKYSIRINNQWGICFEWKAGNAENVEIIDYH